VGCWRVQASYAQNCSVKFLDADAERILRRSAFPAETPRDLAPAVFKLGRAVFTVGC
jgi:hypothetical protein